MKAFDYAAPGSLADGLRALRSAGPNRARMLAGGTDLLPMLKARLEAPDILINLKRVSGLSRAIACDQSGLVLGALTTLADIEADAGIGRHYPLLAQAAGSAATPQLRNMATLGGTLMQRPRCWYFRNEAFHCWLKGGSECMARSGQNSFHAVFDTGPCRAVHPSDLACALTALDAEVHALGPNGPLTIPMAKFLVAPSDDHRAETVLSRDELIVSVRVPGPTPDTASVYLKAMDRALWAFALVSVAAVVRIEDRAVKDLRVVLGGVASVPWDVSAAAKRLLGRVQRPDDALVALVAREALAPAEPLHLNGYKIPMAEALVRRALHTLLAGLPAD